MFGGDFGLPPDATRVFLIEFTLFPTAYELL